LHKNIVYDIIMLLEKLYPSRKNFNEND